MAPLEILQDAVENIHEPKTGRFQRVFRSYEVLVPCTINGIALANIGCAVMLIKLANSFHAHIVFWWLIYALSCLGVAMLLTYIFRIILDPISWLRTDLAHPSSISALGSTSMSISLVAVMATEVGFPPLVSFATALLGACVQQIFMLWFLYQCIVQQCWPEPYYNIAIHSCIFPAVSITYHSHAALFLRKYFLCLGFITLVPSISVQLWRVLKPREDEKDVVANNPSVCVMQGACSMSLTAWIVSPLTDSSSVGQGAVVSHVLFTMSTFVYLLTWLAIGQRRKSLWQSVLSSSPQWG